LNLILKCFGKNLYLIIIHADAAGKKTIVEVIAGSIEKSQAPTPPPDSWAGDAYS
jgi:hypothetical protein